MQNWGGSAPCDPMAVAGRLAATLHPGGLHSYATDSQKDDHTRARRMRGISNLPRAKVQKPRRGAPQSVPHTEYLYYSCLISAE